MKCILFIFALLLLPRAIPAASLEPAWQEMSHLHDSDAMELFAKAPDSREARLGKALALLNQQSKTPHDIEEAAGLLESVRKIDGNDEIGVTALYYLARLAHIYRFTPDINQAMKLYEELITLHPEHPLAQIAVVKSAIIRIYDQPQAEDKETLLRTVAASGAHLTDPPAVRDFNLVMADAYCRLKVSDGQSLEHLLNAYNTGELSGKVAADVLVRIGELARLLGHKEMAIEFYRKFLEEFPRDQRSFTVRQRLAGLS